MEGCVFKRRNDGNATTLKKRKSNLSTAIQVNHESRAANLGRRKVLNAGRRQRCDFFEADGSEDSNTYVLETCMTAIKDEDNPLVVCTLFASALAAYYSSLKQQVKDTLTNIGAELRIIYLPNQANESGIDLEANDQYDVCDANVIMGACVCILFKNISDKSYYKFISNRLHALGGMLGMSKTRLATLTQVQPVTITQAKYIREKLGSDNNLKKEMLLYLMELTDVGGHEAASRYLCMILSWNEMTPFTFVHEKLCLTGSPVLKQDSVRHEVIKFAEAASAVARSPYPQFFRYFCSRDEEELVQRSRFPVLAAVAHSLKNTELSSSTTRNFIRTLPEEEGLVQELVELHNAFLATATMGPDEAVDFLTRDPEVLGYESSDEEDEC